MKPAPITSVPARPEWSSRARELWLPTVFLACGVFYLVGPIDLDRRSHLDEVAILLLSIALAWLAHSGHARDWLRPSSLRPGSPRSMILGLSGFLASGVLLRLCLGRRPTREERRLFVGAFAGTAIVPPILRGLHAVPAAKEQLGHVGVLYLQDAHVIERPPSVGRNPVPLHGIVGNPLSYRTSKPVAFLHFEKTAGVTIARTLAETIHPLQLNDDPQRSMAPHLRTPFVGVGRENARRARLIWGHYDLPSLRRVDPERAIFTILREPSARLVSLYDYWRAVDPNFVQGVVDNFNVRAAQENDLLEFLRLEDPLVRDFLDNVYVRRLCGLYATGATHDPLIGREDTALDLAKAAVDSLTYVGTLEQLDADRDAFGQAIDAVMPARLPMLNRTRRKARVRRDHVRSPAVEAELARLVRLDRELYGYVATRVSDRLSARRAAEGGSGCRSSA